MDGIHLFNNMNSHTHMLHMYTLINRQIHTYTDTKIQTDTYTLGRVTFSTFFETLLWVVWNWMGMNKDSICQKFEVLNH